MAANVPTLPSKLPPSGTESMCEPKTIGGAPATLPARRPIRFPATSVAGARPASCIHLATTTRACLSSLL